MKYLEPTTKQLNIGIGDWVRHMRHGAGRVMSAWGHWIACPDCYQDISLGEIVGKIELWDRYKHKMVPRVVHKCSVHGAVPYPIKVPGTEIVEVKFGGDKESTPIHKMWLQPL